MHNKYMPIFYNQDKTIKTVPTILWIWCFVTHAAWWHNHVGFSTSILDIIKYYIKASCVRWLKGKIFFDHQWLLCCSNNSLCFHFHSGEKGNSVSYPCTRVLWWRTWMRFHCGYNVMIISLLKTPKLTEISIHMVKDSLHSNTFASYCCLSWSIACKVPEHERQISIFCNLAKTQNFVTGNECICIYTLHWEHWELTFLQSEAGAYKKVINHEVGNFFNNNMQHYIPNTHTPEQLALCTHNYRIIHSSLHQHIIYNSHPLHALKMTQHTTTYTYLLWPA